MPSVVATPDALTTIVDPHVPHQLRDVVHRRRPAGDRVGQRGCEGRESLCEGNPKPCIVELQVPRRGQGGVNVDIPLFLRLLLFTKVCKLAIVFLQSSHGSLFLANVSKLLEWPN